MGVKLDWEIEDEHFASNGLGESPAAIKRVTLDLPRVPLT